MNLLVITFAVIINLTSLCYCIPSYKSEKKISKWRPYKVCAKKNCPRILEKVITPHRSVICFPDEVETVTVRFRVNLKKTNPARARSGYKQKSVQRKDVHRVKRLVMTASELLRNFTILNSEIWVDSDNKPMQLLSTYRKVNWAMTLFLPKRKDIFMYSKQKLKSPPCTKRGGGECLDKEIQPQTCFDEFRKSNLTQELINNARIYNIGRNRFWTKNKVYCHCTEEGE